jgi:fatty-acyl-CoA synthase
VDRAAVRLAKIGAILVTVNTALRAAEIDYLLRQSETSTLVTIAGFREVSYLDELRAIGRDRPCAAPAGRSRTWRACCSSARTVPRTPRRTTTSGRPLRGVPDDEIDALERAVGVDDVINMQFTSGTTGFPKGVMLSSRNIVNNGFWLAQGLGFTAEDRICLCVPLFHCFGCVIGVLGAYTHGACLCAVEFFRRGGCSRP